MKSSHKKTSGQQSAMEVRLNRALEEIEKYKSALQKARSDQKVTLHHDVHLVCSHLAALHYVPNTLYIDQYVS